MKRILSVTLLLVLFAGLASAQTTTTSTTLSAAVTATADTIKVASATGFTADTTYAYVDNELVRVRAVSGTTIAVERGQNGTFPAAHASGAVVFVGPFNVYRSTIPAGACTASNELYLPQIVPASGAIVNCHNSKWQVTNLAPLNVPGKWPRTLVSDAAYTAKVYDVVIAYTSLTAARTVTLPSASGLDGKIFVIQDESGQAGSYTITVSGTINGAGSKAINTAYGVLRVRSNGTAYFLW